MKTRILALLMAGALAIGLTACGSDPAPEGEDTQQTAGIAAEALKVGLILAGETADTDSKNHIEGMQAACKQLGLDYDTQVVVKASISEDADCAEAIDELVAAGCQAIFATSAGHEQYLVEAALDDPQIQFCQAAGYQGASDNQDNTHTYAAKLFEARYLAGIAAGLKTETNKLGYVAAKPFAEDISGYTAFYLGAKSVNPEVTMLVNYTNQWADAAKEAINAQVLIDQGCDVIAQHSDTDATATTAEINGVFAVGCNEDWISVAPNAALVSARVNWGAYYTYALDCLCKGEAIAQDWCGTYAEKACYLSDLNEAIAAEGTKEAIEAAAAGLADGSVQVFSGPLYGVDADGNELNLAEGEFYEENKDSSSPSFAYVVDGITVLS